MGGRDHTIQCSRCGVWYGGLTESTHECNEALLQTRQGWTAGFPKFPSEPQISGIPISKFGTHDRLMERVEELKAALRELYGSYQALNQQAHTTSDAMQWDGPICARRVLDSLDKSS